MITLPLTSEQVRLYRAYADSGDRRELSVTFDLGSGSAAQEAAAAIAAGAKVPMAQTGRRKKLPGLRASHLVTFKGPANEIAPVVLVLNEAFIEARYIIRDK